MTELHTSPIAWPRTAQIHFIDGRLIFPSIETDAPAVYRLDIGSDVYIGMTSEVRGLNGRWNHYTRFREDKDPIKFTNNRIHSLLVTARGGIVSWLTAEDEISRNGVKIDLRQKSQLSALEGYLVFVEGASLNL